METRKVQITGRSTYVISLPKTWVNKVNIKNGDSIGMIPRSDGTLLINPKLTEQGEKIADQLTKKINIDFQNTNELLREFIGVYLAGNNIIEMDYKKTISKDMRQKIRDISQNVMGIEIIDESINSITVKDLLNVSDFSIVKGLKRMYIITRAMHKDALKALNSRDKELAEDVESRDNDVDKLYWLIGKQFNLILKDVFFADKMGVKPQEALSFLLTARAIERIADHATRLAKNAKTISEKTPLDNKIFEISNKTLEIFDGAINAIYRNELKNAHEIVEKSKKTHDEIEKLRQEILGLKKIDIPTIVSLTYIVDSIDRTRGYAEDIAEIAVNHYFVK